MDMVPADNDIDCGMHLTPADFRAGQILLIIDMMDMIVFND